MIRFRVNPAWQAARARSRIEGLLKAVKLVREEVERSRDAAIEEVNRLDIVVEDCTSMRKLCKKLEEVLR